MRIVERENELTLQYRFFSIKRHGRLFKSRPRRTGVYSSDLGVYSEPGVYLLNVFFIHPFFIIGTGGLLNWEPNMKQCHQLCLISENMVCHFSKKKSLTGTVIELFLTFYFSLKHGGSVSATVPQQTYCASNSEQGGGSRSISCEKGKIWRDSRKF